MRVMFSFDYKYKLTDDEFQLLSEVIEPRPKRDADGCLTETYTTYTGDMDTLFAIKHDIKITVTKILYEDASMTRLMGMVATLAGQMEKVLNKEQLFNERVNVHVPGLGLLMINETEVWTDMCTERLKEQLDDGWRIIAVCPQPDQRRPDYVLGRSRQ